MADEESLYCFLDMARPCTAECAAYLVGAPPGSQWSSCRLLVALNRVAEAAKVIGQPQMPSIPAPPMIQR